MMKESHILLCFMEPWGFIVDGDSKIVKYSFIIFTHVKLDSGRIKWLIQGQHGQKQVCSWNPGLFLPSSTETHSLLGYFEELCVTVFEDNRLFWNTCLYLGIISTTCVCVALLQNEAHHGIHFFHLVLDSKQSECF